MAKDGKSAREQRLAEALRRNLKRRKEVERRAKGGAAAPGRENEES